MPKTEIRKDIQRIFGWTVLTCIVVRLVVLGPDVDFLLYIMANGVIGGIVLGAMLSGIVTLKYVDSLPLLPLIPFFYNSLTHRRGEVSSPNGLGEPNPCEKTYRSSV